MSITKKNNKPENTVPIQYKIQLERQSFLTKSLAFVNSTVLGLSLDEAISTLLSNNQIAPACYDSSANVKFQITYKDYFAPLNVAVSVIFVIETKIPCYKNINDCDNFCPYSYSCDNKSVRKTFDVEDDKSDVFCASDNGSKNCQCVNDCNCDHTINSCDKHSVDDNSCDNSLTPSQIKHLIDKSDYGTTCTNGSW